MKIYQSLYDVNMVCNLLRADVRFITPSLHEPDPDSQGQPDQSQNVRLHWERVVKRTLPIPCRLRKDDALAKRLQDAFDKYGRTCRDANLGGRRGCHGTRKAAASCSSGGSLMRCFQLDWSVYQIRPARYETSTRAQGTSPSSPTPSSP